ncbi:MAG: Fe-S-containing protein [Blastocatellia bacterium]
MQHQPQTDNRERKRAQFAGEANGKKTKPLLIVAVIALFAAASFFFFFRSRSDQPSATAVNNSSSANEIRIPLADLSSTAKFYDYALPDNKKMRFFALKSSDGVYRAALDACDTCYHAKKGYHQEGDDMVCNNCGLHFHSAQVNEAQGGCNPVGLPRQIEGDTLVIRTSDLQARQQYF